MQLHKKIILLFLGCLLITTPVSGADTKAKRIRFTPAATVSSTNVQDAIEEVVSDSDSFYVELDSEATDITNGTFNLTTTGDLKATGKHIFDSDSDSYLRYNTSTGVVELFVDGTKQVQWPIAGAAPIDIVLLETGDGILLENGVDSILLE